MAINFSWFIDLTIIDKGTVLLLIFSQIITEISAGIRIRIRIRIRIGSVFVGLLTQDPDLGVQFCLIFSLKNHIFLTKIHVFKHKFEFFPLLEESQIVISKRWLKYQKHLKNAF